MPELGGTIRLSDVRSIMLRRRQCARLWEAPDARAGVDSVHLCGKDRNHDDMHLCGCGAVCLRPEDGGR